MHRRPVQEPGLGAYQKQARVGAAIGMKVEDYFIQGPRGWVRRVSILGCASISMEPQREDATRRLRRKPQVLIVKDFSFPRQAAVRADRSGEELVAFEQKLQISLRERLVRALGRYGIPVTVAVTSQELRKLRKRQPAWLITGSLLASIRVAAPCASLWDWGRVGRKWKQPRKFMTFLSGAVSSRYSLFQRPAAAMPNRALSHRSVPLRLRRCQPS